MYDKFATPAAFQQATQMTQCPLECEKKHSVYLTHTSGHFVTLCLAEKHPLSPVLDSHACNIINVDFRHLFINFFIELI